MRSKKMSEKKWIPIGTAFSIDEVDELFGGMDLFNFIFMGKGKVKSYILGGIINELEKKMDTNKDDKINTVIKQVIERINNKLNVTTK